MKKLGIVSYNIYGNFTNYGSALQSWALGRTLDKLGYFPVLVDYCPDVHLDKDILDPLEKMWDQDVESRKNCELSLPAIRENYYKFEDFFSSQFVRTKTKYTYCNFNESGKEVDGYICGSDTIFCIDESNGFDDAFFANYQCMKNNSIAYAASFGDTGITAGQYNILDSRLKNFKAIGLREDRMFHYVKEHADCPVSKTVDPTLLLADGEFNEIMAERFIEKKYLLLYARRYNHEMEQYAEYIARKNGWELVEISLRVQNAKKGHIMQYSAGVEEFLSLVKNAEYIVTNSFHGLLFSVRFQKQFAVFSRETGDSKIQEALELFGLTDHLMTGYVPKQLAVNDYSYTHGRIAEARDDSMKFLKKELSMLQK